MSVLSRLKKPAATTLSGGIPLHLPEQLTLSHPHCRVAKTNFMAAYRYLPGGFKSYGATVVSAGSLADDRSALVRDYPRNFRKPTKAERQGPTEVAEVTSELPRSGYVEDQLDG